ncbi:MAG: hypothetical protein ACYDA8_09620 [Deferrisomatales bacterium]
MKRVALTWLVAALAATGTALADQGLRGRASHGGVLVEGLTVRAYPYRPGTFGPLTGEAPAGATLTATDGTYRLPLPPGQYVVEGLQKRAGARPEARPEEGDLHCLYSGSPVTVASGAWSPVGLNLSRVPAEARAPAERPAVAGRITLAGEPVEKVYLYVYADAASAFRGPARLLQPVANGAFRVRLPPGTYYLVARKRAQGGAYGPIEIGDLFNFYPRNPVTLRPGEEVNLEIPLVERLSQLEEEPGAFQGLRVRVLDAAGAPAVGFHVLAYPTALRSGPPLTASSGTDAQGWTRLPLAPGQKAFLRARRSLGGPLAEGEPLADGEPGAAGEVVLRLGAGR